MNFFTNILVCLISTSLIGKPKLRFKLGSFVKYMNIHKLFLEYSPSSIYSPNDTNME